MILALLALLSGREDFERELDAWRAIGGVDTLEALQPAEVPDDGNAAVRYRQAFEGIPSVALDDPWSATPEARREFLDKWEPVFRGIREAQERPSLNWGTRYADGFAAEIPYVSSAVRISRALVVEIAQRAHEQDWEGVSEAARAGLTLSDHVTQDPFLVNLLVQIVMDSMVLESLQRACESGGTPDESVMEVLRGRDYLAGLRHALLGEGAMALMYWDEDLPWENLGVAPVPWYERTMWRLAYRHADMAWYLREVREGIERLDEPYTRIFEDPRPRWAILSGLMLPALGRAHERAVMSEASVTLARLAVAVRQGAVPADWPDDPFDGEPIRRQGGILWSVGPDGVDNGGDPDSDVVWRWE